MVTAEPEPVRRRRHGEQLEAALLEAGWDELVEVGYARLTMESIALRAQTSEAVLYRRWPNKDQLVVAAIEYHRNANPVETPDTGSLRGDLLAELTTVSQALAGFFAIAAAAAFSGLLADTGLSPAQVRDKIMASRPLPPIRTIYQRAHDRGEIDLDHVPAPVLALPFDLLRLDMLMQLEPARPERIRSIVDELFLPLLQAGQADRTPPRQAQSSRRHDDTGSFAAAYPASVQPFIIKPSTNNVPMTAPNTVHTRSLHLFRKITSVQRKAAEDWIRTRNLTVEQAMVIGYLQHHPGSIQRDIAAMSHTTPANISLLLTGLERRGLIERRTAGGNGRRKPVYATPAGIGLITGLDTAIAAIDEQIFTPLTEPEQIDLQALLDKIDTHLPQPGG